MSDENKLKLEDITFDDFIGEGLEAGNTAVADELGVPEVEEPLEDPTPVQGDPGDEHVDKEDPVAEKKEVVEKEVSEDQVIDDTVVSEVLTQLGYEFEEDFEDTSDGLIKLTKAVGEKMAEQQLDSLFEAHPEIQKHLDYVLNGGKSEEWLKMSNQITDFENITVTEDDQRTQRAVLGEYFKLKGHDTDFVNELLDDYSDTNKLFDKATKAKTALTSYYGKQRDESIAKEKERRLGEQQKQREFWDDINDTITNSKDFAGLTVQEKDKNKFFDYLTKVNQEGITEREAAHKKSSTEQKLAIDYLMFKGFNLKDIIATKAKTVSAQSLREKIKSNKSVKSAARPKRQSGFDVESLDLNLGNL